MRIWTTARSTAVVMAVTTLCITIGSSLPLGSFAQASGFGIYLTSWSGPPGSMVGVHGYGYTAGEAVHIDFQGVTADVTTDSGGNFSSPDLKVPKRPAASYAVKVSSTSGTASANYYIEGLWPSAWPFDWYLTPGQAEGIHTTDFGPSEKIDIFVGGNATPAAVLTADVNGAVGAASAVPTPVNAAGKQLLFHLVGESTGVSSDFSVTVGSFWASATPSLYYALPGQAIGIAGAGYAPNDAISVTGNGITAASFSADVKGSFSNKNAFTIPFGGAASQTYLVKGGVSGASASFTISIGGFSAQATPSLFYALPGQKIGFSGNGFASGEKVDVTGAAKQLLGTFTADANGNIKTATDALPVPFGVNGSLIYMLKGQTSGATASFTITVGGFNASAVPSAFYALPGDTIGVKGSGFAAGENVKILDAGAATVANMAADTNGVANFTALKIPFNAKGTVTYTLKGDTSAASASFSLSIGGFNPTITPSSFFVPPQKLIAVSGTGFSPNETVILKVDNTQVTTATADAKGAISSSFRAPKIGHSFILSATGQQSGGSNMVSIAIDQGCIVEGGSGTGSGL